MIFMLSHIFFFCILLLSDFFFMKYGQNIFKRCTSVELISQTIYKLRFELVSVEHEHASNGSKGNKPRGHWQNN